MFTKMTVIGMVTAAAAAAAGGGGATAAATAAAAGMPAMATTTTTATSSSWLLLSRNNNNNTHTMGENGARDDVIDLMLDEDEAWRNEWRVFPTSTAVGMDDDEDDVVMMEEWWFFRYSEAATDKFIEGCDWTVEQWRLFLAMVSRTASMAGATSWWVWTELVEFVKRSVMNGCGWVKGVTTTGWMSLLQAVVGLMGKVDHGYQAAMTGATTLVDETTSVAMAGVEWWQSTVVDTVVNTVASGCDTVVDGYNATVQTILESWTAMTTMVQSIRSHPDFNLWFHAVNLYIVIIGVYLMYAMKMIEQGNQEAIPTAYDMMWWIIRATMAIGGFVFRVIRWIVTTLCDDPVVEEQQDRVVEVEPNRPHQHHDDHRAIVATAERVQRQRQEEEQQRVQRQRQVEEERQRVQRVQRQRQERERQRVTETTTTADRVVRVVPSVPATRAPPVTVPTTTTDPLARILAAQNEQVSSSLSTMTNYQRAKMEMQRGRKESHWMWYTWPSWRQIRSHSRPTMLLESLGQHAAYLQHPVLGRRLVTMTRLAGQWLVVANNNDGDHRASIPVHVLMGGKEIDCIKFHEACTVFGVVALLYSRDEQVARVMARPLLAMGGPNQRALDVMVETAEAATLPTLEKCIDQLTEWSMPWGAPTLSPALRPPTRTPAAATKTTATTTATTKSGAKESRTAIRARVQREMAAEKEAKRAKASASAAPAVPSPAPAAAPQRKRSAPKESRTAIRARVQRDLAAEKEAKRAKVSAAAGAAAADPAPAPRRKEKPKETRKQMLKRVEREIVAQREAKRAKK